MKNHVEKPDFRTDEAGASRKPVYGGPAPCYCEKTHRHPALKAQEKSGETCQDSGIFAGKEAKRHAGRNKG